MIAPKRSSFIGMFAWVALAAVGFTALSRRGELWHSFTSTAMLFALLAGMTVSILARGHRRAYWIGFSVFGWGFFLLVTGPWVPSNSPVREITSQVTEVVFSNVATFPPGVVVRARHIDVEQGIPLSRRSIPLSPALGGIRTDFRCFDDIVHHLLTILVAAVAGSTSAFLVRRAEKERADAAREAIPNTSK